MNLRPVSIQPERLKSTHCDAYSALITLALLLTTCSQAIENTPSQPEPAPLSPASSAAPVPGALPLCPISQITTAQHQVLAPQATQCYESLLGAYPDLKGSLELGIEYGLEGSPNDVVVFYNDMQGQPGELLEACIIHHAQRLSFKKCTPEPNAQYAFPFVFAPKQ